MFCSFAQNKEFGVIYDFDKQLFSNKEILKKRVHF